MSKNSPGQELIAGLLLVILIVLGAKLLSVLL